MDDANPYASPVPTDDDEISRDDQPKCPLCGETAEKGYIRSIGSIDWQSGEVSSFKLKRTERLTSGTFALEGKLKAIRCVRCRRIIIET